MKKYLFSLFLVLAPFVLRADLDPATEKAVFVLEEAERHRQEALQHLKAAEDMSLLIPSLEDRKSMGVLLGGAVAALATPGITAKARVILVGVSLLSSMTGDIYDRFCEYRLLLIKAENSIDMMNFYLGVSKNMVNRISDKGDRAFFMAIEFLTLCVKFEKTLVYDPDSMGADPSKHVARMLRNTKSILISEFKKSKGKVTVKLSERLEYDAEEIYELNEAVGFEQELLDKVLSCFNESLRYMQLAEYYWGLSDELPAWMLPDFFLISPGDRKAIP